MPKMEKRLLERIDKKFPQINNRRVTLIGQQKNDVKRQLLELNLS